MILGDGIIFVGEVTLILLLPNVNVGVSEDSFRLIQLRQSLIFSFFPGIKCILFIIVQGRSLANFVLDLIRPTIAVVVFERTFDISVGPVDRTGDCPFLRLR